MKTAILVVDPQIDFFPGGSLAVPDGDSIIVPINKLISDFDFPVIATKDWHPSETRHFMSGGGRWPPHCIQGTEGAEFHPDLKLNNSHVFFKGSNPDDDGGYSAFDSIGEAMSLDDWLKKNGITNLIVCGLATDFCVKATVKSAVASGYSVLLFKPGIRAVFPNNEAQEITELGKICTIIHSHEELRERNAL